MCHSHGRRNSGTTGEAVKELSAMATYKKTKQSTHVQQKNKRSTDHMRWKTMFVNCVIKIPPNTAAI